MKNTFDKVRFKEKLESSGSFPMLYLFKFIVPSGKQTEVGLLFPGEKIILKPSSAGKYVSITIQKRVENAEQIIALYEKASQIEGIISL
ncbi:MAG: hypothetical protein RL407_1868 [Bacteroidota bacterium]|jgi:uncharacterized protein|nr:DUF493 domain-containing protein [Cyclobacteriaceae bacterium]